MPKLNQIVAIEDSTKKRDYADLTKLHQTLQKSDLFSGFVAEYQPNNEEGQKLPTQRKEIQFNAPEILKEVQKGLTEMWDVVATKDFANCEAKADVVVDGKVLAQQVPVTHLIFLEKQINDIRTLASKLPTLDPSKSWVYDTQSDLYKTAYPEKRIKTKKVHKSLVKIQPSEHSPGDAEIITVDEPEGEWTQIEMSSALPSRKIKEILERISKVQNAIKFAREEANSIEVQRKKIGDPILSFIFEG